MSLVYGLYEQVAIWDAMDDHFLAVVGYLENDDVSTKSIVIFIIELGVLVIRASGKSIRMTTVI